MNVPEQVGQENQEGRQSTQPDPFVKKHAALFGQQQTDDNCQAEDGDGVFLFEPQAGDDAKPEPVAGIVALDSQHREVSAAHPQVGFEAVGGEQAAVGKILRGYDSASGAEQQGEAASAKLAGEDGGLDDQKR